MWEWIKCIVKINYELKQNNNHRVNSLIVPKNYLFATHLHFESIEILKSITCNWEYFKLITEK